jgi:hypothetical protein
MQMTRIWRSWLFLKRERSARMTGGRLTLLFSITMITSGLCWAQNPLHGTKVPIKPGPVMENICIENIQNLSHRPVNMEGVDDELVVQLQRVGLQANRISAPHGKRCDATVNAELVEITGRRRKTARVDFRLTLAGEEPPRMSASAYGKSSKSAPKAMPVASSFREAERAPSPKKLDQAATEREAIVAALVDQAHQIKDAYQRGLPPWVSGAQ